MKISFGFSLIEMAMVLLVIGLLMGGLLTPLSVQIDYQRIKLTEQRLAKIKEALLGFAIINNGRLPCPAKYDQFNNNHPADDKYVGKEEPTYCTQEGYLPWIDLGVGRYDGWGNSFRYRVEDEYTTNTVINTTITMTLPSSELNVRDTQIDLTKTPPDYFYLTTSSSDSRVVAVILSYGKNGKANNGNNGTKTFVQDVHQIEKDSDDILTWLSRNTLMNRLIAAGKWPPTP